MIGIPNAIDVSVEGLSTRTKMRMKVLHVYQESDGTYYDLDLNIKANNQESLEVSIRDTFASLGPNDILPSAPLEDWMKFASDETAIFIRSFILEKLSVLRGYLLVMIRGPK